MCSWTWWTAPREKRRVLQATHWSPNWLHGTRSFTLVHCTSLLTHHWSPTQRTTPNGSLSDCSSEHAYPSHGGNNAALPLLIIAKQSFEQDTVVGAKAKCSTPHPLICTIILCRGKILLKLKLRFHFKRGRGFGKFFFSFLYLIQTGKVLRKKKRFIYIAIQISAQCVQNLFYIRSFLMLNFHEKPGEFINFVEIEGSLSTRCRTWHELHNKTFL